MDDQILTPHFRLSEFSRSSTADSHGIDNSVPKELIPSLKNLCEQVLEPLREHFNKPVVISSGYRCPKLNRLVGGVPNSQHQKGEAADIKLYSVEEGKRWFNWIVENCNFDQALWERESKNSCLFWIHISCRPIISKNRHQAESLIKH